MFLIVFLAFITVITVSGMLENKQVSKSEEIAIYRKTFDAYIKLAEKNPMAMFRLGCLRAQGVGAKKPKYNNALRWFNKALMSAAPEDTNLQRRIREEIAIVEQKVVARQYKKQKTK